MIDENMLYKVLTPIGSVRTASKNLHALLIGILSSARALIPVI